MTLKPNACNRHSTDSELSTPDDRQLCEPERCESERCESESCEPERCEPERCESECCESEPSGRSSSEHSIDGVVLSVESVPHRRVSARDGYRVTRSRTQSRPSGPPWDTLESAKATVGRRVKLYWGGDRAWYAGCIVLIHPTSRKAFIKYDDHDERWHAMWEELYEFLDA